MVVGFTAAAEIAKNSVCKQWREFVKKTPFRAQVIYNHVPTSLKMNISAFILADAWPARDVGYI